LAAAACIAGLDAARMDRLPDTAGMAAAILIARTHRNAYDHALRAAGARLVEVGLNDRGTGAGVRGTEPWQYLAAITPDTVAVAFTANPETIDDLPAVAELACARKLPVIVDAAAQLPPKANLKRIIAAGADLVVFSGGKAIGGPQASGILAGRRDLVASAVLQQLDMDVVPGRWRPPVAFLDQGALAAVPTHGLGRGFKAGKEEIAGLLTALRLFAARDEEAWRDALVARLDALAEIAGARSGVTALVERPTDMRKPLLHLTFAEPAAALAAVAMLDGRDPPISVGEGMAHRGRLTIDLTVATPADDPAIAAALATL
jgi:L-seryl-tRNA(Ser) seleniumtransferase